MKVRQVLESNQIEALMWVSLFITGFYTVCIVVWNVGG